MKNREHIAILALVLFFLVSVFAPPGFGFAAVPDTQQHDADENACTAGDSILIYFSLDQTDVRPYMEQNHEETASFIESLKEAYASGRLKKIEIRAYSCLIGTSLSCNNVAHRRAQSLADYIIANSGIPSRFVHIEQTGIGWDTLAGLVRDDMDVPGRNNVLKTLSDTPVWIFDSEGKVIGGKKKQLMEISGGRAFAYMRGHFFEKMRYASATFSITAPVSEQEPITFTDKTPAPEPVRQEAPAAVPQETPATVTQQPVGTDAATEPETISEPVPAATETVVTETAALTEKSRMKREEFWETSKIWLKTNIPYWGLVVPNIAAEVRLADHWSLDIPVFYSPFTVANSYRFRIFAIQPSVRYWLKPEMKGHFFGVHLTGGAFNIAVDDKFRYQDTDGVWGAGIDYGYALKFSRHWGMEFNIGVGYLWTKYQTFYNVENGAPFATDTKNYFGITRVGISLIYKL